MADDIMSVRAYDADRLLKIFRRFGPDGRAISATSLQAGFNGSRTRLAEVLKHLLDNGTILPAGRDPLITERAYRLAQPVVTEAPAQEPLAA